MGRVLVEASLIVARHARSQGYEISVGHICKDQMRCSEASISTTPSQFTEYFGSVVIDVGVDPIRGI